jgi:hypothetical protein
MGWETGTSPFVVTDQTASLGAILNCSCPYTKITVSHRPKHSYITNTNLLSLCHLDKFRPSKGVLQGVQLIRFNGKVNGQIKIQLINEAVL